MKRNRLRWALLLGLAAVLGLGAGLWRLGTLWSGREIERRLRAQLTAQSALVLGPLEVQVSPWHDFPHLVARIRHLALTDTAHGRAVPVLSIERVDMRLALNDLWERRLTVSRLEIAHVVLHEEVDSLGRAWGLRGRRARAAGPGVAPAGTLEIDSILVFDAAVRTANAYTRNGLAARIISGRFSGGLRDGVLRLRGTLAGELEELRNRNGALLRREPLRATLGYSYQFVARRGAFAPGTFALLRGDTVAVSGSHTVPPGRATGTWLDLRFAGSQPLVAVLTSALPLALRPYLAGASSTSKAHIIYTLQGLSGPTLRPHTHLVFNLRGASLHWPDPLRRISRWDLAGTLDNGAAHSAATTRLDLTQCRFHSPAGQLDAVFSLRDFLRPLTHGRVRGRTTLPELATVLGLRSWRARRGLATVDLTFAGRPARADTAARPAAGQLAGRTPAASRALPAARRLSVRGTIALFDATLGLPRRRAEFTHLSGLIGLRDSLWTLKNVSGELGGTRFRGTATTRNLYRFLTGQSAQADVRGELAATDLRPAQLAALFRLQPPGAAGGATGSATGSAAGAVTGTAAAPPPAAPALTPALLPPGLRLALALRCDRLLLPTDTLRQVALLLRHDGRRLQLSNARARLWGGTVGGDLSLPANGRASAKDPVRYDLALHFGTLSYSTLAARFFSLKNGITADSAATEPEDPRPNPEIQAPNTKDPTPKNQKPKTKNQKLKTAQLLTTAAGRLRVEVNTLVLPTGEALRTLSLQLDKAGPQLRLPYLTFVAPQGGRGSIRAAGRLNGLRLAETAADIDLRYRYLDVPQLLQTLASVAPGRPVRLLPGAGVGARPGRVRGRAAPTGNRATDRANRLSGRINRALTRAEARASRSAGAVRRLDSQAARAARRAARPEPVMAELFEAGALTATLRISADQVRYAAVRGSNFRLQARLLPGQARLDLCTLNTLQGQASLQGQLRTDGPAGHHPLRVQLLLDEVALPALFGTLTDLHLNVLSEANVRGTVRCAGSISADLGPDFLPRLAQTTGYLHADLRRLELLDVDLVTQALRFLRAKRTTHLFFEPVSADFLLANGQLLIPRLRLNSNLTNLELSGAYGLDGRTDLYLGLNPLQVLFGSNRRRVASIETAKPLARNTHRLTYLHLTRPDPVAAYQIRLFKEQEQRRQQTTLRQQVHGIIREERLDTTLRLENR